MSGWITPKEAAALAGVGRKTFLTEWIPEEGPAQCMFRNPNGKTGKGRRPEILESDLLDVLASRTTRRAG